MKTLLRGVIDEQSVVVVRDFLKEEVTSLQTLEKREEFQVNSIWELFVRRAGTMT